MATPSILIVPDRYKSGVLYSQLPETGAVDFDVTRATTAFRTNASGVLESVASGVPRLDYAAAGGCPSLLIEPEATNLILRSEEFDDAYWVKVGSSVTANTQNSPAGTLTADKLITNNGVSFGSTTSFARSGALSLNTGSQYVVSISAKPDGFNVIQARMSTSTGMGAGATLNIIVNMITGLQISGTQGTYLGRVPEANGYHRYFFRTNPIAEATNYLGFYPNDTVATQGNGTNGISIWGAQLEIGSVATSYIPTTSATVTRNADEISKSGVSGFIGQSAGTLYAEVDVRNFQANARILAISDGTSDNRIALIKGSNSTLRGLVTTAALTVADIGTASGTTAGVYKIALAYAANDFVLYVNGSQIGTDTSGTVPACSQIFLGKIETSATTNQLNDRIRAAAIYTTRLSNSELAALTTL